MERQFMEQGHLQSDKLLAPCHRFIWFALLMGVCLRATAQRGQEAYLDALAEELLLNGREYKHFYVRTDGVQFLTEAAVLEGDICYDGICYQDVELNYDIYNDLVFFVWKEGYTLHNLAFNEKKLTQLDLLGMTFRYVADSTYPGMAAGIYESAFQAAETQLWVKYAKKLVLQSNSPTRELQRFEASTTYYLLRGDEQFIIKNKRDLLKAFSDVPELRSYLKEHGLKLRKRNYNFRNQLIEALEFASQKG